MKSKKLLLLLLVLSVALFSQIVSAQTIIYDDSDGPFTILAQMVTVLSPNGGENWNGAETHNITWSLTSSITSVNIYLSLDGGNNWIPVASNIANSGSHPWTVPATPSSNCLMRISAAGDAGNNDVSNRIFSISASDTETVTAPTMPTGPVSGSTNSSYSFSSTGANSNFGDALQYRFDWGDGTDSGWLSPGTTNALHSWAAAGAYDVKAMARCAAHTAVESPWSETHGIIISEATPVLQWNTFLGGLGSWDEGCSIAVDGSGNTYIAGGSDYTWGSPLNPYAGGDRDAFVAKLNANGVLLWHTFLGGTAFDYAGSISLDNSGNIYIAGSSASTWGSPLNPFGGVADVFVAKLNASGVLQWNTFMGGSEQDTVYDLTVDGSRNIYVTGWSRTTWGSPLNPYAGGYCDTFVAKLNAGGAMAWNTFLGGSGNDMGSGVTFDAIGNVFVIGWSNATWGSPLHVYNGNNDAFVAKLNSGGTREWHTFIGGGSDDLGRGISVDGTGNVFVVGDGDSGWGSPLNPYSAGRDAFAAKFNAGGAMMWNTFLGGSGGDYGSCVALDNIGNILILGDSYSSWGSPLTPYMGDRDTFVGKLNVSGARQWHSFWGSNREDSGGGLTLDGSGNILVTGTSQSTWGLPQRAYTAYRDTFVAKLGIDSNILSILSPNGGEEWMSGSSHDLTWSLVKSITNVNIDYSTNNGGSWIPVATNTANDGLHSWTVPATPSSNCLVRVSNAADAGTYDVSNSVFTITAAPTLTVSAPNGGENWISGSSHDITWISTGIIVNVNIDYSTNSGGSWIPVAASISNSGSYAWIVPATLSTTCLVRVSDAANAATYDVSNTVFSISAPPVENITAPTQPSGPGIGLRNTSFSFSTGGSTSSFGHDVQYKFDWGDGSDSGWLATGTTGASHAWSINGIYPVRAMARCATHTGVESSWSETHSIIIHDVNTPVLQWHTFQGGNEYDTAYGITSDNSGNTYVTGVSNSTWGSPLHPFSGNGDAFVAKFNSSGILQWHTFIGGNGYDEAYSIAIDNNENIFITGDSDSTWGSPLNPYDGGYYDAFVTKLNASGVLQWNTFLGGSNDDEGDGIAIDSIGNIYVLGMSRSTWGSPLNPYGGGDSDTFVVRLNVSGIRQWHTFLGGAGQDFGYGITLDSSSNIYLTGVSDSTWGSPLNPYAGAEDAFVAKFNSSGTRVWHTFLGGSSDDMGNNIGTDKSGNILVAGSSVGTWGSPLNPYGGGYCDAFVVKMTAGGAVAWHTFLGGDGSDGAASIVTDNSGNIYITGNSDSTWGSPLNPFAGGTEDVLIAKLNASGIYQWHTFLGGDQMDSGGGISLDGSGNIYMTGSSGSNWGSPLHSFSGNSDALIAKLGLNSDSLTIHSPNGGENWICGSVRNITWSSTGVIANVNIDYSTDGGSAWISLATNEANDGSFSWTIPDTSAGACLVRVSDAANASIYDVSDEVFSISIITTLTISGTITSGGTPLVNVVMNGLPGNPTTNTSGFYSATVSYNWSGSATPTLAGCTFNPANTTYTNITANQTTDYTATVTPTLLVTSPNGGEQWQRGTSQTITWTSVGVANVKIELMKGTAVNLTIASSIPAASGSYTWLIPASQTVATNYKIRITSTASSTVTDSSNASFSIFAPAITVTAPAAGSVWAKNTVKTIAWSLTGTMDANVKIQLYSGTTKKLDITLSTQNDASYDWLIPFSLTNGTYTVKITTIDGLVVGNSGSFSIVTGIITITAPAAGASWQRGVLHTITWIREGTLNANVKIQLIKGSSVSATLATSTPNDGNFDWTIPAGQALATNYKIRIITVDSLVTSDSGVFSITNSGGLTLLSPNSGECLQATMTFPIRWTIDPSIHEVKLEYSRDNGSTYSLIADNIPNTGYYEWLVPVNFTSNAIIRVSDSHGKDWLDEEGVIEFLFKFDSSDEEEPGQPDFAVWFGTENVKSLGYGFARVGISQGKVRMVEASRVFEPLSGGWHEAKIRIDFKHDLGTLYIDDEPQLANVPLNTSPSHHFEAYLSIRVGGEKAADLLLSELRVRATLLSADGNEKDHFVIMAEDFSSYESELNVLGNCWQAYGVKLDRSAMELMALPGLGKALRLQSPASAPLTLGKALSIPEKIPFDISDRSFVIEMKQGED